MTPGTYQLMGSVLSDRSTRSGWTLVSAVANGRDALDLALEIRPGESITDAVVTFTDKTQELSGVLRDARGAPVAGHTMLIFPTDRAYWRLSSDVERLTPVPSGRTAVARTDRDGRYVVNRLVPGDYFIAALTGVRLDAAADASRLEIIAASALRFQLALGEKKVFDLRVGSE